MLLGAGGGPSGGGLAAEMKQLRSLIEGGQRLIAEELKTIDTELALLKSLRPAQDQTTAECAQALKQIVDKICSDGNEGEENRTVPAVAAKIGQLPNLCVFEFGHSDADRSHAGANPFNNIVDLIQ